MFVERELQFLEKNSSLEFFFVKTPVANILPFNLMKGLNFLVFRFSSLPLNTWVYIFQVLVSFPLSSLKNPYEFSSPAWGGWGVFRR